MHAHFIYKYKCNSQVKLHYARKSGQTCSPQRPCSEHYFSPLHPSCLDLKKNYALFAPSTPSKYMLRHSGTLGNPLSHNVKSVKPVRYQESK